MSKQEPKLIKFIPSGKRLPYWDRYEFECVDCGSHYFRGTFNNRTSPYCGECQRKHDSERNAELRKKKQTEHDKLIIDEFAIRIKTVLNEYDTDETREIMRSVNEISEIMKEGVK